MILKTSVLNTKNSIYAGYICLNANVKPYPAEEIHWCTNRKGHKMALLYQIKSTSTKHEILWWMNQENSDL